MLPAINARTLAGAPWHRACSSPVSAIAEFDENKPKVKGRIITTISKAKEVRPLVEKCITIARKGLLAEDAARQHGTTADRGSDSLEDMAQERSSTKAWNKAVAPSVTARRRCLQLLGDKQAVFVLFAGHGSPTVHRSPRRVHADPPIPSPSPGSAMLALVRDPRIRRSSRSCGRARQRPPDVREGDKPSGSPPPAKKPAKHV